MNLKRIAEKNCAWYTMMMRNMTNGAWSGSVYEFYANLKKKEELKDTNKCEDSE